MSATNEKVQPKRRGRKPGIANVSTRNRNRLIANAEVKPLQVLMDTMAARWHEAQACADPDQRKALELAACSVAEKVAPYLHPKLQATTLKGDPGALVSFVLNLPSADELRKSVRGE